MTLNDIQIKYRVTHEVMIENFIDHQVNKSDNGEKVISYGLTSFGYDVRIANKFKIIDNDILLDPKHINDNTFQDIITDELIILPNSFALGYTIEKFKIPRDIISICVGKSTLARLGIIVNVTPLEPLWEGHVTIEISNTTKNPVKIYANEGIAQFLFLKGSPCQISYADKCGKYQNQQAEVVLAK